MASLIQEQSTNHSLRHAQAYTDLLKQHNIVCAWTAADNPVGVQLAIVLDFNQCE